MKFIGFALAYGHGNALTLQDCETIEIAGCEMANFGDNGITVHGSEITVRSCDLHHLGRCGVILEGGDRKQIIPANNRVENCHIHHFGLFQRTYAPAVLATGCGQIVKNNRFHDAPHNAVLYWGSECLFEKNDISRVVMETGDAGAFYTGRDWTTQGNIIRHNVIYNLGGGDEKHINTMGVYLDDCDCGDTIEGNLFYQSGRAMMIGGGRDNFVLNNLFIHCPVGLHIDARGMTWKQWNMPGGGWNLEEKAEALDYKGPIWSKKYPSLARIMDEEPQAPLGNVIRSNIFIDCAQLESFDNETKQLLNRLDIDDNMVVKTVIPENDDKETQYRGFRELHAPEKVNAFKDVAVGSLVDLKMLYDKTGTLRNDCPNFHEIPMSEIGLYLDEYRNTLP